MEFSVLLSVYVKENPNFLRLALNSIWEEQTLKPSEIILVKDGKLTMQLEEVIDNFSKSCDVLKIVPLESNVGLGKALAFGLNKCSYDLVARMDTDDISEPQRFEKQVKFMYENPNVSVVGGWVDEFDSDTGEKIGCRVLPESHMDILKFAKRRNPLSHPSVLYRKEEVLQAGSYQHFHLYEDYYLWVRMLNNGAVFNNIPLSLLKFRSGRTMISRRGGLKYLKSELKFQKYLLGIKFISFSEYIQNCIIRICVRLLPSSFIFSFYKNVLRNKVRK